MAKVSLPRTNQTGLNEWADVEANDNALKEGINEIASEQLGSSSVTEAKIANLAVTNAKLAAAAKPVVWYTPKVTATEQTRESATYGTLTTADEISSVVLPENGLIMVGFTAKV